jgi:hypothetical protein
MTATGSRPSGGIARNSEPALIGEALAQTPPPAPRAHAPAPCSEAARRGELGRLWRLSQAPGEQAEQIRQGLKQYAPWLKALATTRRVILDLEGIAALIGSPGSGKTLIGTLVIQEWLKAHATPARYEVLADAFAFIREAYGPAPKRSELDAIREFTAPALLVLDEIDKRGGSDAEQRVLHRIIDKRYRAFPRKPTLLIGNVADENALAECLDGFAGEGIGPLFDRLRQRGGIVTAFGWNFRGGSHV